MRSCPSGFTSLVRSTLEHKRCFELGKSWILVLLNQVEDYFGGLYSYARRSEMTQLSVSEQSSSGISSLTMCLQLVCTHGYERFSCDISSPSLQLYLGTTEVTFH